VSTAHQATFAAVFFVSACAGTGATGSTSATPTTPVSTAEIMERAAATITAEGILADIEFLASDDLRGRDTPSPGLEQAAEYLAGRLQAMGLEPAGTDGYLQRYPFVRTAMVTEEREVGFEVAGRGTVWEFGKDYYVIPGQQIARDAGAIWAGSAASPASDLAAKAFGKVAFFSTRGNPVVGDGEDLLSAFTAAAQAGASGIVLVLDQTQTADSILDWANGIMGSGLATPTPIVGLSSAAAHQLLEGSGHDPDLLRDDGSSAVDLDGVKITVAAPFATSRHTPPNVVAILRGSDPVLRDEYIVYSAHFDHVGVGLPDASGDSIYNGADDDASGTAVVMAAAKAFASLEVRPKRSVIFLAVSGEEKGLLGSKFFSENPTVPIQGIVMNINLDMVGRNHPDSIVAVGRQYTNLGDLSDQIVQEHPDLGLTIIEDPKPEDRSFFRSDHLHFVNKDIPAIFFTTWDHEDYHKPSDEVADIDGEKAARVARLVFYLGSKIASGEADPEWAPGGLEEVRRIIAEGDGN
jgi:peptidase M28-like protein